MTRKVGDKKIREYEMRTITCFGDRTSDTFLIIASVSRTKITRTDNCVKVNVFNSVTSPRVLSYRCILHYFLTMPVGFNFNLTIGLKPQVGSIKIATTYKRSIFQVDWLIASLIQLERPTSYSFAKTENQCLVCSQTLCLPTRKKTRAERARSTQGWRVGFASVASRKNREAVDIFGKK